MKECIICNYSNVDYKTFENLGKKLEEIGYRFKIIKGKEKGIKAEVFTGSILIIYAINNNFIDGYKKLEAIIKETRYILVIGYLNNNRIYLESYIKNIPSGIKKEEILINYLYKQIRVSVSSMLVGTKLLVEMIKKKNGKY